MNKIYRIYEQTGNESIAIGYLISESDSSYLFRVQKGPETYKKEFDKASYRIESIYEQNGETTYQIKTKNSQCQTITVDLSKSCYGGCG